MNAYHHVWMHLQVHTALDLAGVPYLIYMISPVVLAGCALYFRIRPSQRGFIHPGYFIACTAGAMNFSPSLALLLLEVFPCFLLFTAVGAIAFTHLLFQQYADVRRDIDILRTVQLMKVHLRERLSPKGAASSPSPLAFPSPFASPPHSPNSTPPRNITYTPYDPPHQHTPAQSNHNTSSFRFGFPFSLLPSFSSRSAFT